MHILNQFVLDGIVNLLHNYQKLSMEIITVDM